MKKTFLSGLLLFVAAVTLSNCSKDETTDPTVRGNQLRAAVEEPTRTSLDGTIVTWELKDKIKVVNQNAPARAVEYTLTEGSGTGNGIFAATAPLSNGAKWAFYPSSAFGSCADNAFAFTLPATQEYLATSFANEAYPMVAQSAADGTLAFKNLCGIIKLQLAGSKTVASIQLKTAGEKIAGPATVAMNYTTAPTLACDAQLGTTTVTLQNINSLLSDTPTSFFFVVPAGEYAAGLTFTALDDKGAVIYTKTTAKALTVIRSEIAALTPISTLHFPDPKFRAELVATYGLKLTSDQTDIDVNNEENKKLFANTTELNVNQKEIATLQGIEYFTKLTFLDCSYNQLTSLDVSKNTALTYLDCKNNLLTSLDVTKNTALTYLDCKNNLLTSLDVSQNTALTKLYCESNQLTNLDVSKNTALNILYCYKNQLTSLNIITCSMLTKLACGKQHADGGIGETYTDLKLLCLESQKALTTMPDDAAYNNAVIFERIIAFPDPTFRSEVRALGCRFTTDGTDIDVTNPDNKKLFANTTALNVSYRDIKTLQGIEYFTALTYLGCTYNQLTSLDLSQNTALTDLDCGVNKLTSLDLSKNTALINLYCYANQLTSLDLSKNTALTKLYCESNQLTSLDLSQNTALTYLECNFNQLTSLDVSKSTALIDLYCACNKLTSLNVSQNTALKEFWCQSNQLTSLDVSQNTALTKLNCYGSLLTSLDLTQNTALTYLDCGFNKLPSLDVSQNTTLTYFNCYANQLTSLNVSKNTTLTIFGCAANQLTSLDVRKNTALTIFSCGGNQLTSLDIQSLTSLEQLRCGQQSAGGVVYPNYSELKLFMTQAQFNANLGVGDFNENVKRVPPDGK